MAKIDFRGTFGTSYKFSEKLLGEQYRCSCTQHHLPVGCVRVSAQSRPNALHACLVPGGTIWEPRSRCLTVHGCSCPLCVAGGRQISQWKLYVLCLYIVNIVFIKEISTDHVPGKLESNQPNHYSSDSLSWWSAKSFHLNHNQIINYIVIKVII